MLASRLRAAALTSSMYKPEPIIQFQGFSSITYCSLGTGSSLPGRGKLVST